MHFRLARTTIRAMKVFFRFIFSALLLVTVVLTGFWVTASNRETVPVGHLPDDTGRMIETSVGAIFALDVGDPSAPPVLFAHGTAAWSGLWRPTLSHMSDAGFRAIAFDMPPFGWSEPAQDEDYSRTRQAERIVALLEELDSPPIAVAHSIGAGPVAEAVMLRPDLVSGLVVVCGAIALEAHESPTSMPIYLRNGLLRQGIAATTVSNPLLTRHLLRAFLHVKLAATPEIVSILRKPMAREGYTKAVADWLPHLLAPPQNARSTRAESWRTLDLPVALIWGAEDTVTPVAQAQALKALLPDAPLIVLPNVGHIPQIEDPDQFQTELIDVLNAMSGPTLSKDDA